MLLQVKTDKTRHSVLIVLESTQHLRTEF